MMFYADDYLEDTYKDMEKLANELGAEIPTNNSVWCEARESEDIPHIGNIFMSQLLNNISTALVAQHNVAEEDVGIYVNGLDTHLSVFGIEVSNLDEIKELIKERNEN